jgi:hypothetical protein
MTQVERKLTWNFEYTGAEVKLRIVPTGFRGCKEECDELLFRYCLGRPAGPTLDTPYREGDWVVLRIDSAFYSDDGTDEPAITIAVNALIVGFEDRHMGEIAELRAEARRRAHVPTEAERHL